jgi:hypothetical protein
MYRVIKTINNREYFYDQETYRENGRVRTRNVYIGPVDGTFFRGGGRGSMPRDMTAQDVLNCEASELGNELNVAEGVDLSKVRSDRLQWVTKTKGAAKQYGDVDRVVIKNFRIVATDPVGGMLVEERQADRADRRRKKGVFGVIDDLVRKRDKTVETENQIQARVARETAEDAQRDRINDLLTADTISLDAINEIAEAQAAPAAETEAAENAPADVGESEAAAGDATGDSAGEADGDAGEGSL